MKVVVLHENTKNQSSSGANAQIHVITHTVYDHG